MNLRDLGSKLNSQLSVINLMRGILALRSPLSSFLIALVLLGASKAFGVTPMISAGGSHSVALRSDGQAWSWGANASGQLGDWTNTARVLPGPISSTGGCGASSLMAAMICSSHILAADCSPDACGKYEIRTVKVGINKRLMSGGRVTVECDPRSG